MKIIMIYLMLLSNILTWILNMLSGILDLPMSAEIK